MKKNKRFLAVFIGLWLFLSFGVSASAMMKKNVIIENKALKTQSFHVAMEYIIRGRGMQKRGKDGVIKDNEFTGSIDAVGVYIILNKFLKDSGLWDEEIKEQIMCEIFDVYARDLKLTTEIEFFFKRFEGVKKLKKAIEKTNFKNIEITKEMFDFAMKEIKDYVMETSVKKIEQRLNAYKTAFEKGNKALVELDIKNSEDHLKYSKEKIKEYSEDSLEYAHLLDSIKFYEKNLDELKNKTKLTEEREHHFEVVVKNLEKFLEEAKAAFRAIERVKYENIKGINRALEVEKTLIDLRTYKRI